MNKIILINFYLFFGSSVGFSKPAEVTAKQRIEFMTSTPSKKTLAAGLKLYKANCIVCHGETGHGDGAAASAMGDIKPRNFHKKVKDGKESLKYGSKRSQIYNTLVVGRADGLMPPWGSFSEHDLWLLTNIVWSWIPEKNRKIDSKSEAKAWTPPIKK